MRIPCAQIVEECDILDKLVRLLVASEPALTANKNRVVNKDTTKDATTSTKTPKWLAPLLLLIDRLEKVATLTSRKRMMYKVRIACKSLLCKLYFFVHNRIPLKYNMTSI